jgi:hypothetical protein
VAAVYRKAYVVFLLNFYAWVYLNILQRPRHIFLARIGKGAIIFAKAATQAPFFVYINSFHAAHLNLK